ncbi:M48 family metalloprotease [bacterium]|nr:M48 family metalloprotease [bacterium]
MFQGFVREQQRQRERQERMLARQRILERQRRIELARKREALHRKLLSELKLLDSTGNLPLLGLGDDDGKLPLMGMDGGRDEKLPLLDMEDGLRPRGTALFGTGGGGKAQPHGDPNVVDLRNLRTAAYLVRKAEAAGPADGALLRDWATDIADGKPVPVSLDEGAAPAISEKGLLAFQKANNDYRRAVDSRYRLAKQYQETKDRSETASLALRVARSNADKADREGRADAEALRVHATKVFEAAARLYAEHLAARVIREATDSEVGWSDAIRRLALRGLAVPGPPALPPILQRERKALEPSRLERWEHAQSRRLVREVSDEVDAQISRSHGFVRDPAVEERLQRLVDKVRNLSPYPDEAVKVKIVDHPRNPADASGHDRGVQASVDTIYFGREYLAHGPSDDEILFVAGHELAHVQRDHLRATIVMYRKDRGAEGIRELVQWSREPLIDAKRTTLTEEQQKWIRTNAREARLQPYNQAQELEADRLGASMALAAGAKPSGMRDTFTYIRSEEKRYESLWPLHDGGRKMPEAEKRRREITSQHPQPDVRLKALETIYGRSF